ncbi:MAG: hypothetical protein GY804_13730 [Alphaproteobacteria bacterium]|nr:hypothetical protein [Alphaproteobacteria bacterium]
MKKKTRIMTFSSIVTTVGVMALFCGYNNASKAANHYLNAPQATGLQTTQEVPSISAPSLAEVSKTEVPPTENTNNEPTKEPPIEKTPNGISALLLKMIEQGDKNYKKDPGKEIVLEMVPYGFQGEGKSEIHELKEDGSKNKEGMQTPNDYEFTNSDGTTVTNDIIYDQETGTYYQGIILDVGFVLFRKGYDDDKIFFDSNSQPVFAGEDDRIAIFFDKKWGLHIKNYNPEDGTRREIIYKGMPDETTFINNKGEEVSGAGLRLHLGSTLIEKLLDDDGNEYFTQRMLDAKKKETPKAISHFLQDKKQK